MGGARDIDYRRDSLAEILFEQEEQIGLLGEMNLALAASNLALREDAELLMSGEHQRYAEVLILVENWVQARHAEGNRWVDAGALLDVIRDVFLYAEDGKEPHWYGAAVEAMGGNP